MSKLRQVVVLGFVCVLFGGAAVTSAGPVLVINEIMAANSDSLADPQGQYDDWVELYNADRLPINLAGMYLTDDLSNPRKWQIPAGNAALTTVAPGAHVLIWADGDTSDAGLHAGFNLNADRGEIGLFDTDGESLIDGLEYKDQRGDIAFGRSPDGSDAWGFMVWPTPGAANGDAYAGVVGDTRFSLDRGFYDTPFEVAISCRTAGAQIYYTLDGSPPYSEDRQEPVGIAYAGPIGIDKTTCLRAVAVKPDWLASNVDTQTYIFVDDVIRRRQSDVLSLGYPGTWFQSFPADYEMDPEIVQNPAYADLMDQAMRAIPTLSVVSDKGNFFDQTYDPETGGIYIYTGHPSTGGQDWERPVSAELFTADGTTQFQLNCGIRIQGGEGRRPQKCPKHSFSLRFRSQYGPAKLASRLFEGSPVDEFDSLQLRGFFNNSWSHWDPGQRARTQYIRDQWMRDSLLEMGQADAGRGFFVHLYINGIYWGLYNLQERPVASHYAAYHGGDPDLIDAINGGRATDGTATAWQETIGLASAQDWGRLSDAIDMDNFIDWTLLNIFAGNVDLKTDGNWRAAGGGIDHRPWRFYSWDGEHVLENVNQAQTRPSDDPTGMLRYLDDIDEFRVRFGDRVHKHLFNGGALVSERNAERWNRRAYQIEMAVIGESARWGDYRRDVHSYSSGPYYLYTRDDFWMPEWQSLLNNYFPRRTDIALRRFRSMGLYPDIEAPVFHIDNAYQHGGHVATGARLTMEGAPGEIWYTLDGSDPRSPGTTTRPGDEYAFVSEDAAKTVLVPTGPVDDAWRGGGQFDDSGWISGTGGVGYETSSGYEPYFDIDVRDQMYGAQTSCYIRIPFELTLEGILDASGLKLKVRYDDGFIAYINGIEVQRAMFSGEPSWNSSADGSHSDVDAVVYEVFDIEASLNQLRLGRNVLAVQALNQSAASSDFLLSVELITAKNGGSETPSGISANARMYRSGLTLDASTPVKARALVGGAWSALNEATYAVGPVAEGLRISEIMYHPVDPNTEYIELTNVGNEILNLNLVAFTDGVDFTFGSVELAPGGYTLAVKDWVAFEAKYGQGLPIAGQYTGSLANGGERIELQDATGRAIHDFSFDDRWYDTTDGSDFSLTVIDPSQTAPEAFGDQAFWRPSTNPGGSPGFDDTPNG